MEAGPGPPLPCEKDAAMNTANLQLEGLYLAIAAMHETMIAKGLVSRQDVDDAMRAAEQVLGRPVETPIECRARGA